MDPIAQVFIAGIVCAAAAFMVKAIADGAVRMQQLKSGGASPAIEERLARIEAAVDAIAIEVERSGELQRFTARLAAEPTAASASRVPLPPTR